MPRLEKPYRIAVIGAGPAGLSAAHFVREAGHEVTVFEANDRIGGKSYSVFNGDTMNELGTCYTTRAHRLVKRWMAQHGITLTQLGEARFDGRTVIDYVKSGGGPPLAVQAIRFVLASRRLRRDIATRPADPKVCTEAAMTTQEWVRSLGLPKIELAMHRVQTTQGYGYTDVATIGQTVQWCDLDFLLSGVTNNLHMPDQGWSEFWRRFSADFDIRLSAPVMGLDRTGPRPVVRAGGETAEFDAVVSTVPMQAFNSFSTPSPEEAFIHDAVEWQTYTTTLFSSTDWFDDYQVTGFSRASRDQERPGAILGGRREGESADLGGRLYVTGQFSKDLEPVELRELLLAEADFHGFSIEAVIQQKCWEYFPQYRADAVREGLFDVLQRVQGQNRTWFGGATFSHELVSNVVAQAQRIVTQMLKDLPKRD